MTTRSGLPASGFSFLNGSAAKPHEFEFRFPASMAAAFATAGL